MATVTMKAPAPGGLSNKARELMEAINTEAGKHNVWVRTQANAPAQRPWFSETSGEGSGQLATGRVAVNQMKTAALYVEVERIFTATSSRFPRSPARPTCRRSNSPTGRAFLCSIPA